MESQAGGHIDIEISMMHPVQSPQHRNRVKQHMLKVDSEVQEDHRGHYTDPGGEWQHVEEPKPMRLGNEGHTDRCGRKNSADQERVHNHDANIIRPPPAAPNGLGSSGSEEFPSRHQDKYAAKRGQPDILLT